MVNQDYEWLHNIASRDPGNRLHIVQVWASMNTELVIRHVVPMAFSKLSNVLIDKINVLDHITSKVPLHNSNSVCLQISRNMFYSFHRAYVSYGESEA